MSIIERKLFSLSDGFYKPTNQIKGAHNKAEQNPSSKAKKKRNSARGMAPSVVSVRNPPPPNILKQRLGCGVNPALWVFLSQDSQQSVTVVLFQDQYTLISSGAVDG